MSKDETSEDSAIEKQQEIVNPVIQNPPVDPRLLDKLPPGLREQFILMMSSHSQVGGKSNPIAEKLTPEHIGTIIENADKDSQRDFKAKWFTLAYAVLALGFLVFLFIYLPTIDKALFLEVLKLILTFLGGLGTGFGISKWKKKEE